MAKSRLTVFYLDLNKYAKDVSTKEIRLFESIFSKVFLFYIINSKYKIQADEIILQKSKNGKPYILNGLFPKIKFSISHSKGYIVTAISTSETGIDVECIDDKCIKNIDKYSIVFSEREVDYIKKSKNRVFDFYKIWTLKEATIKLFDKKLDDMKHMANIGIFRGDKDSVGILTKKLRGFNNKYVLSLISLNIFDKVNFQEIDFIECLKHINLAENYSLFVRGCLGNNKIFAQKIELFSKQILSKGVT